MVNCANAIEYTQTTDTQRIAIYRNNHCNKTVTILTLFNTKTIARP